MIEKLIEYSCRNKFLIIALFVGLAAWGYYVMRHTPVDAIPDLSENQVIVFTDWMGRSPKEIEDQITYPLSVNLQGLAGVKAVRSSSEFNFSMINIIFEDSIDFYFARTRVLERLALASTFLPEGVVPYLAPDATALGQIYWYTVEGDNVDVGTLRATQDWLVRYQLNSVPGVAQVSSVGGFPREYQIDVTPEKLRAYNITLGEIFSAIARSNSSVGGRVVHKGNAEYLIRGVGWIRGVDDIRNTVITERNGQPVRVSDIAVVQMGSEFRRSVLEKDGREVTGGVVMMRYGENPLDVTKAIKAKIQDLQSALPPGVRIVPFYDRTRLIESSIETVTTILEHELIIAAIAILLILTHVRSVLVIIITLPLSILFAFILMRHLNISSNIMSLSGIAISIGILVDQAIVMLENSTHHLAKHFGDKKITGDTTEIIVQACRQVGRPIFFSVVIMVLSFLPVFALTGQEGKLFHPLAFTKTFALIGTAIISITLVPAIIPLLIRGKLSKEENNWIVRSVVEIYRPMLGWLMQRPKMVIWLFVLLLGVGFYFARHLGREFMPPLDEGSIMDMPVTSPRASVTEVADDLKVRDAMLRELPEVEMVVGKGGRADTPTDPSPLDMVETIITLRPREHWLKRKMELKDATAEAERMASALERDGVLKLTGTPEERKSFLGSVAGASLNRFDGEMRRFIIQKLITFDEELAGQSVKYISERLLEQIGQRHGWKKPFTDAERDAFLKDLSGRYQRYFVREPLVPDVKTVVDDALKTLQSQARVSESLTDPLASEESALKEFTDAISESLGRERVNFYERTAASLQQWRDGQTKQWIRKTNDAVFYPAMEAFERSLLTELHSAANMQKAWDAQAATKGGWTFENQAEKPTQNLQSLANGLSSRAFLWPKTKADLVAELDAALRVPGWSNIWTQPIINRVDMLATGVRTQIGIKVFGRNPDDIQKASNDVSNVVRNIAGAVDVVADQTVGKGYVEVELDREKAARYGANVGDIQDVIEVALGGKPITTTVEGRERFPVRLRYARDYRVDEESIRRILVSAAAGGGMSAKKTGAMAGGLTGGAPAAKAPTGGDMPTVYLGDVANVKVTEGPVMIKSENGLLRSYVQLNVRDRDIVGFVEEAQRVVASKVKLPEGAFLEWSGQFEHQVRAKKTLRVVFPAVLLLIFVILYITYNDFAHAVLMMLAVPGALAGGVIFQTLFGYNFSVAVWVGYIACFGMATETGIIMLVYLRDAIAERGGLEKIASLEELEAAIMAGAVHRLRPKLLTEGTAIVGLAPMLWSHGVGSEVIAPMAAPVLGGLLIADEVIDIFLPVLFYQVEKRRWQRIHNNQGTEVRGSAQANAALA
ncbi:MAG TPA: efflux RND transporter permease subunit [Planctomycetota bacterium]|jgi:Cu(I)/Ag(I) efflux system membrane protein CusA/SilA